MDSDICANCGEREEEHEGLIWCRDEYGDLTDEQKPKPVEDNDRYRVEIFSYKTGEVEEIIGRHLRESKAEQREMLALSKTNDDYGVRCINERTGEIL